jgi:hypothetical protein
MKDTVAILSRIRPTVDEVLSERRLASAVERFSPSDLATVSLVMDAVVSFWTAFTFVSVRGPASFLPD